MVEPAKQQEYGYYSRVNGDCDACWYDCTNFVSQVIKTGGIKERNGRYDWFDYWFYDDEQPGLPWAWPTASTNTWIQSVKRKTRRTSPSNNRRGYPQCRF